MIWTTDSIFEALGSALPAGMRPLTIDAIRLDPDECSPGSLFVPSTYSLSRIGRWPNEEAAILAAIGRGASAALTNLTRTKFNVAVPVLRLASGPSATVEPTVGALIAMARYARAAFGGRVIAITGSVGKTTTKDMVHHVLAQHRRSFKTAANRNSIAGICQTVINLPSDSEYCVLEVGATQRGHMRHALVARPEIGIVTNVGLSHLENYGSAHEIAQEKLSLFDHLEGERIGFLGSGILEGDGALRSLVREKGVYRLITVGFRRDDDIHVSDVESDGVSSAGTMSIFGRPVRFRLPLPGRHFLSSAMFAAGVGCMSGLDADAAVGALATAMPTERRSERFKILRADGAIELIDDSYNAAPASVEALLDALGLRTARRKVLVLGDMLELGACAASIHEEIAQHVGRVGIDLLVTVGELSELAAAGMPIAATRHFADALAASRAVPGLLRASDLVAVKGSSAVGLDKVVAAIAQAGSCSPAGSWRIDRDTAF